MLAPAVDDPSLLEPIVPGRPDLRAQALYAREREWARTDEDVFRRRTTVWLAGVRSGIRVQNEPSSSLRAIGSAYASEVHAADPAARS